MNGYASGEHAANVAALGSWDKDLLRCDLDNLHAAAIGAQRCRDCVDRLVFERFSLRAALLLHADRHALEQFASPLSEQVVRCGTEPPTKEIERLAGLLVLVDSEARVFLKSFYLAMARHAQWSHCLRQARLWARAGLKWLPKDATLLMTLGITAETTASTTLISVARTRLLRSAARRQLEAQNALVRGRWDEAREAFEEAVTADAELQEAQLRLGRTLWRLNQPEAARARLEAVLARTNDSTLLYLAHLFLGRILEDRTELAAAEREYHAALSLRPLSETAAVAVSHARFLLGDRAGAREVLGQALERDGPRAEMDPYERYSMAHTPDGQKALAELRQALVQ